MIRVVWAFGLRPGSQHLFASGFGCIFLPSCDEYGFATVAGLYQTRFDLTFRKIKLSVTFGGVGVLTEAVVAVVVLAFFELDIKLIM